MSLLTSSAYVPELILSAPKEVNDIGFSAMLSKCVGVAFLKVYRLGMIITVRAGKGVLLRKIPVSSDITPGATSATTGTATATAATAAGATSSPQAAENAVVTGKWKWSAPCAITFAGPSLGASVGVERSKYIIFLMSDADIHAFVSGTLSVGINGTGALGSLGRAGEAFVPVTGSNKGVVVYADSSGLYGGISLEFTGIMVDHNANEVQYGQGVSSSDIIEGKVEKPTGEVFDRMYKYLDDSIEQHLKEVVLGGNT